MDNESYEKESAKVIRHLQALRIAERDAVIPFMNGDFTEWDLYLASSSEYVMRLIDGLIPLLELRNLVCAAQLLRAQVGVCLRTLALFVAADQNAFLDQAFADGRVDKMKDRSGRRMTDARLQEWLELFDPNVRDVYGSTSAFVHFSTGILPSMGVPEGENCVEFNFGAKPNERNNAPLLECRNAFCHYADLHLQMLRKVIDSDEWYSDRTK